MKVAWITGARGFLGRHVARNLSASGWRVIGIGNGEWNPEAAQSWGIEFWRSAEISLPILQKVAETVGKPDMIFHAAGSSSVGLSLDQPLVDFQRTVLTTAVVLEAVRTLAPDAVVVYPSSAAVYGLIKKGPIQESATPAPVSPYGAHKMIAEQLCLLSNRHFGLRCAIIRYFSVYGPGLRKQLLWELARKISGNPKQVELYGSGEETRDFLHVEDASSIVSLAADRARSGPIVINGGSGQSVSVRYLAEAFINLLGRRTVVRFTGQKRLGDPPHYQADITRLTDLGFTAKWTLQDGLRNYAKWVRQTDLESNGCE